MVGSVAACREALEQQLRAHILIHKEEVVKGHTGKSFVTSKLPTVTPSRDQVFKHVSVREYFSFRSPGKEKSNVPMKSSKVWQ